MKNFNEVMRTYLIGFMLSIILTFGAYFLVLIHINSFHETIPHFVLIPALLIIAFIQLTVQLIFFLHLGQEKRPRWNMVLFIATFTAVLTVVFASIWIMNHLNYNMTPRQMNQYIEDQSTF